MEEAKENKKNTKFAPAHRYLDDKIQEQREKIEVSEFLDKAMSGAPYMFFIVNDRRQVVYSNQLLMEYLGYEDIDRMLGYRPGELLSCVHSNEEEGGCGTSASCRYCGAVLAMLESKKNGYLVRREAIINVHKNEVVEPMNFEISSKPFFWKEEEFYVFTLQNIEDKKRKEQLERTFFHDITNKAGNVSMYLDVIGKKYIPKEASEFYQLVRAGLEEMIEDIHYQKSLSQAEKGNMEVKKEVLETASIIGGVVNEYMALAKAYDVKLSISDVSEDFQLVSDKVLVKRILGNLIKNAIEASTASDEVKITAISEENDVLFSVSNPAEIPHDIQMQIFNRSFSTKGEGRGIGTYSIKLFTERYLNGRASFVSGEKEGTIFTVRLPKGI